MSTNILSGLYKTTHVSYNSHEKELKIWKS